MSEISHTISANKIMLLRGIQYKNLDPLHILRILLRILNLWKENTLPINIQTTCRLLIVEISTRSKIVHAIAEKSLFCVMVLPLTGIETNDIGSRTQYSYLRLLILMHFICHSPDHFRSL